MAIHCHCTIFSKVIKYQSDAIVHMGSWPGLTVRNRAYIGLLRSYLIEKKNSLLKFGLCRY